MRTKLPKINESESELKKIMKSEKDYRKKQRLQMLYLLKSGQAKTKKDAAKAIGLGRNTIGRWLQIYETQGLEALLEVYKPKGRPLSLPDDILNKLKKKLDKNSGEFRRYNDVVNWLEKEFGLEMKYKTVHKIVKYNLKSGLKDGKR